MTHYYLLHTRASLPLHSLVLGKRKLRQQTNDSHIFVSSGRLALSHGVPNIAYQGLVWIAWAMLNGSTELQVTPGKAFNYNYGA